MSDSYLGAMRPEDTTSDYNLHTFVIRQLLGQAMFACLVRVDACTNSSLDGVVAGTVDVTIMVDQVDGQGKPIPHGPLYGLPYLRYQAGSSGFTLDPVPGDIGLVLICDRDISVVKATKASGLPGSFRRNSPADGLYIGGFLNGPLTQFIRMSAAGIRISSPTAVDIDAPAVVNTASSGHSITTPLATITGAQTVTGNQTVGGNLTLSGTDSIEFAGGDTLTMTGPGAVRGSNTGDQTLAEILSAAGVVLSGTNTGDQTITLSGDVTGSGTGSFAATLATVNANVGTFTNATVTVDAKGRVTAASAGTGGGGTITLTGDVTGSGTGTFATTLATANSSPGTYALSSVTVDGKGRVTAASAATTTGSGAVVLANGPIFTGSVTLSTADAITFAGGRTLTVAGTGSIQGTNTGDQTITLTGDVTGSGTGSFAATLATVNSNVGSFALANVTVDAKGRVTAASAPSTTGTGSVVLATAPTLSSATFTGAITPSQTAGIVGTTTNNNANAGSIGEYMTVAGGAVGLTSSVTANATSLSLTAGDWDVEGICQFIPSVSMSLFLAGISTTSAVRPAGVGAETVFAFTTTTGQVIPTPVVRVSLSATTTVFLTVFAQFTSGTVPATGTLRARRVR